MSVNYPNMSAEDKAKEPAATRHTLKHTAIADPLNVEAHGYEENVYFSRPFVTHMLAGIQYALGDLKADDSPSKKWN